MDGLSSIMSLPQNRITIIKTRFPFVIQVAKVNPIVSCLGLG